MSTVISPSYFPDVSTADEDGLLMVGGELSTAHLIEAYHRGIFPWPMVNDGVEILSWWSPDPRAIFELDGLHVSRRLRRRIRRGQFRVTLDRDFAGVIHGCSQPRRRQSETWITRDVMRAYRELHDHGIAHSVEVWQDEQLAGGLYGVALGGMFVGESMFFRVRDASKVALVYLINHLRHRGFTLFDIQLPTEHTRGLGATLIPRDAFLARLHAAVKLPASFL